MGLMLGFIIGIIFSVNEIIANRYVYYKMFMSIAYSVQKSLNKWTMMGVVLSLIIMVIYLLLKSIIKLLKKTKKLQYLMYGKMVNKSFPPRHITTMVIPLVLFLLISNLLLERSHENLNQPNVILISIDDLRADHLGCYGYSRDTSPNIDSFAKRNILFNNCYVHEPWTLPSHMSMLTSLYPITHSVDMSHSLNPSIITLTEVLKNEGYITEGFACGGPWIYPVYGFGQGFYHYNAGGPERNAKQQNALVAKCLEEYKERKLFLFIHYFDVHSKFNRLPYDVPPPYNDLFTAGYDGTFKGGSGGTFASEHLAYINRKQIKLREKDLNYIMSLYDNGIAYMDKCIGDLFSMLKDMDLFDNSLIIITADHGEEFQEHGYMMHGNPYYYEEIVRVPLIVKLPMNSKGGRIINNLVESIDIMPFILDFLGIRKSKMQGRSFKGTIDGAKEEKEFVFGFGSTGSLFIRSERWKMLNDSGLKEGRFKLFDLQNDPMERVNLIGKDLAIEATLKKKLKEKIKASQKLRKKLLKKEDRSRDNRKGHKDVSLTQEEKEKLRALGYLE
jgi:arylsulfatase A-like enzyme